MSNLTWVLTALAAVVVLLTRTRLVVSQRQAGVSESPRILVNLHLLFGVIALATWVWWLLGGPHVVGEVALVAWWLLTFVGLLVLARWLPSHGRHSGESREDGWARGPWLSVLGHVGMLLGVGYFTWVFVADKL